MSDTLIESVLLGKLDCDLLIKWLKDESLEGAPDDCILFCCNKYEFVSYFLSFLRNQTDAILQTNSSALHVLNQTPDKALSRRKHHRSISDPTYENDRSNDSLQVKTERKTQESPNREKKKTGRRVKTKLFIDDGHNQSTQSNQSSDESRLSIGVERLAISSTPMKNGFRPDNSFSLGSPVTPTSKSFSERCDTPRMPRHSRSQDKSVSLGDYIASATKSSKKKRASKNTSNDEEIKVDLDISNSEMFPEIGTRKASSLRSERRRIKPTNIDKINQKSVSLNSFNEAFQQPPLALEDNIAFKPKLQPKQISNNFEAERNILREERHKLMEKFNILNTNVTPKSTPQIKIMQKDSSENKSSKTYEDADASKVVLKEKIDLLLPIYNVLLKDNLILSVNTEIYFLISILLLKQEESDYKHNESQIDVNPEKCLLKVIHNSTYFAVKSLWNIRSILEVILDKNSLKTLGENKKVRSFFPDLAKFLLNSYGLKCEAEMEKKSIQDDRCSNGIVCFNIDTDNADNFPSLLSFQNFKKQRDMFYEILRWYQETQSSGTKSSLRSRIKTLLGHGGGAANHAHLAALFTHLLLDCEPSEQESKLHKLQRRLTCPAAQESHKLPHFTNKEMFFKEFIMYAENESFRVHLKDALASEIISLDSTPLGNETSNNTDISREFFQLSKKLGVLAKFLGYLTSLPYNQVSLDMAIKTGTVNQRETYSVPKERVLENNIALRNYSQPSIDLKSLLIMSYENRRLCITLPWIVHYLSMLDYTTLRIKYYQELLKMIYSMYIESLKNSQQLKKITVIFLKSVIGWLFDLPHFPRECCAVIDVNLTVNSDVCVDTLSVIDEAILVELCPFLKDINLLLSSKVANGREMGSFRHITPVSLSVNNEDRMRNKEKELQARLEVEFLKSQPSSTRRVLELVVERVTSSCIKELGNALSVARQRCRELAWRSLQGRERDRTLLLSTITQIYTEQLSRLRALPQEHTPTIKQRVMAALNALLPTNTNAIASNTNGSASNTNGNASNTSNTNGSALKALHAFAVRACIDRLVKWTNEHWNSTAILCKDINGELNTLLALGDSFQTPTTDKPSPIEFNTFDSPAMAIISLKELICQLLEYEVVSDIVPTLELCSRVTLNNPLCRSPAQKAILQLSVDFSVVFVSRKPSCLNDSLLSSLHSIWNNCCPDRKTSPMEPYPDRRASLSPQKGLYSFNSRPHTPEEEIQKVVVEEKENCNESKVETQDSNLQYFERILCPRNIQLLSESVSPGREVWSALSVLMVFLLKNDYLSEDSLTEQCLAVYRQDWPQIILENLSTCMKSVSSKWSRSSTGKFTLFLDFLADYCGNMDFEPLD